MIVADDARLEVKFAAREHEVDRVQNWLKIHPGDFYKPYADRRINNIYFDTIDCSSYSENIAGSSCRSKLRYRWYGHDKLPVQGTLELKLKRNLYGWKERVNLTDAPCSEGDRWSVIRSQLIDQLNYWWRLTLHTRPIQTIINRYSREYFVSRDDKIRFTIDYDQEVYGQWYKPFPNVSKKSNIPRTIVLECKFAREDRDLAVDMIQTLPIRVSRNSKYAIAIKSMHGF